MAGPGRPPKYETVAQLEKIVKAYFAECDPHVETQTYIKNESVDGELVQTILKKKIITEQQPYTMAGLAYRLGLSRQGLKEYKDKDEFSDTIKWARQKVEAFNEAILVSGKNATGAIFNLKVNFDYREMNEDEKLPVNEIVFVNRVPVPEDQN